MRARSRKPLSEEESVVLPGIKAKIEQGGWSLRKMGRKIGLNPSAMSRMFKEKRGMDIFEFIRIALALGKDPKDFLGEFRFTVPPKSEDEVIVEQMDESLTDRQFDLLEKRRRARKKLKEK